jgi:hypothetical protein
MGRDGARLLAAAERHRHDRPRRHAVILNLAGLLHIDEPLFRRTLRRWLAGDGRPGPDGALVELFDLAHSHQLVLSIPDSLMTERRQAIARVAAALDSHHRGAMEMEWFDLSRQGEEFATAARRLIEEVGQEEYPDAPPAADALDRFMEIERTLHSVDITSLLRETLVFRSDGDAGLVPVMVQRTVAIEALDRLFATRLRHDPWLFDQVTTLLDRRMLFDLLHDNAVHDMPVAVKLHAATVAGEEFRKITARFPARLHGKLVVELPYLEWVTDPSTFEKAMTQAQADEIGIAIDHLPPHLPAGTELPQVGWYRIPWRDDGGAAVNLAEGIGWLDMVGEDRCILSRCHEDAALADAQRLGIRFVQGTSATHAHQQGLVLAEKERQVVARTNVANQDAEAQAEATRTKAGGGVLRWLSGLFGGTRGPGGGAE